MLIVHFIDYLLQRLSFTTDRSTLSHKIYHVTVKKNMSSAAAVDDDVS